MRYKFVFYDEKYHTKYFTANSDFEAVNKSMSIDTKLGICFDLFRVGQKLPFFNDEVLNGYVHWHIDEY